MIDELVERNREYVESRGRREHGAPKYPGLKTAVVSCMDTRLVRMLPDALGVSDGEVVFVKNAGGRLTDPYGETMRALLVAVYELGVDEVMFIGHTNCGAQGISPEAMERDMLGRGISAEAIERVKVETDFDAWLSGFGADGDSVRASMEMFENHPLVPKGVAVRGFVIDVRTGELSEVLRSQHLQAAGDAVYVRLRRGAYAHAGLRPGLDLGAPGVGYQAGEQPLAPGLGHDADHLVPARHLQDDLPLAAVHPGVEGLPVPLLRVEGAGHRGVPDLGRDLALAHVQVSPDDDDELVLALRS